MNCNSPAGIASVSHWRMWNTKTFSVFYSKAAEAGRHERCSCAARNVSNNSAVETPAFGYRSPSIPALVKRLTVTLQREAQIVAARPRLPDPIAYSRVYRLTVHETGSDTLSMMLGLPTACMYN